MDQLVHLLDGIKLPFHLPLLMHPPLVHFAIALPIIALLLEISNIFIKRRCIGVISSLLLLLAVFVYLGAFFAGKNDGSHAFDLLSDAGQAELKEHKLFGIYLVYGIGVVFILKLIFASINKTLAKAIFALILAIFVALALKQGKDGGELVYKYGANVAPVAAMDDKIMNLEDKVDTLQSDLDSCTTKLQKAQSAAAQTPASTQEEAPATQAPEQNQTQTPVTQPSNEPKPTPESNSSEATSQNASSTQQTIKEKATQVLEQIKQNVEGNVSAQ